ncbi:MAG: alpha/beta fold hydrolase, partial [Chromatiales bacterium]|nr:alpha/beta fold hydrolase [Chromatiales bacterium]
AGERRKHHSGAAVLALVLDAFKSQVLRVAQASSSAQLRRWSEELGFNHVDELVFAASRPTHIVTANITFYPIRVDDNFLRKGVELFVRGRLTRRAAEELLVEGNILLRETDMDIRLGQPILPSDYWSDSERKLMGRIARRFHKLEDFFDASKGSERWREKVLASRVRFRVLEVRDEYMRRMYSDVTVNLSHLASSLVLELMDAGFMRVERLRFGRMLYRLVKLLQDEPHIHRHTSICDPDAYAGLLTDTCAGLQQFVTAKTAMRLLNRDESHYEFMAPLQEEHHFDAVRLDNLILVYANEVAPLSSVTRRVTEVCTRDVGDSDIARLCFDDELRQFESDRVRFRTPSYSELNSRETATADPRPFLLEPDGEATFGVIVVHGFLASPAEMHPLATTLTRLGYVSLGARLRGHGTSPWDLHERRISDWNESVIRAQQIMGLLVSKYVIVGFSTGGALALLRGVSPDDKLAGVVAVNPPMGFRDKRMHLIPFVNTANEWVGRITGGDGVLPFQPNDSEHPDLNYASIPVSSLHELTRLANKVKELAPSVSVPTLIIQGADDPVVDPDGAKDLQARLGGSDSRLLVVPALRHGIVFAQEPRTLEAIEQFVKEMEKLPSS